MENENKELTFGQEAVGLDFNPGGNPLVNRVKQLFADVIDLTEENYAIKVANLEGEGKKPSWKLNVFKTAAFNTCITAQMAVVKFITWTKG